MKKVIVISSLIACSLLSACGKKAPECNAEETQKLVKQIAQGEFAKATYSNENAAAASYALSGIRTTNVNKETGARQCAAHIDIRSPSFGNHALEITYNVELTDDGQFYVTVFGL